MAQATCGRTAGKPSRVDIRIEDVPERSRYELTDDGKPAGLATYKLRPGVISFLHTEIDDAYEHHGLGGRLAAAVLDDARARGLRARPVCPFIEEYIEEHPEYGDLVDH